MTAQLPPGFRFHPTDEELIIYYLTNQATSKPCPASIIPEIDIYKFDPWELPDKSEFSEKEWYFFSPRDRKYPNGVRPNRAAVSGYWKATGTDKAILSGSKYVGVKKALVFYKGKPPKGIKTDWIMHEYRLVDPTKRPKSQPIRSMRLDDWVLCRIYKKKQVGDKMSEQNTEETPPPMKKLKTSNGRNNEDQKTNFSNEKMGSISHLVYENPYPSSFDIQFPMVDLGYGLEQDEFANPNFYDIGRFHVNDSSFFNQPLMLNQVAFD